MKKFVLALFMMVMLASSKGRIAWYGEREFEESITSLEQQGYTIKYIDSIDEKTLSVYDVLVICLAEPSQAEKEAILTFVDEGGGLLILYNALTYDNIDNVLSQYQLERTVETNTDIVFPFLPTERVDELRKRVSVSQKGKGRIFAVGYDPLTFQTVSLLVDVDNLFKFGMDWLCQDWHVDQTQREVARKRLILVVPVVLLATALAVGYFLYRKRKSTGKKPESEISEKSEKIRELKAKFVYGEVSRDEYQRELERLERSDQ